MIETRAYFDWNATAPLRPEARTATLAVLQGPANASSVHAEGRAARRVIEEARVRVAALADADPSGVTFTSGATEANMLALSPELRISGRTASFHTLLVSATEHPSVLAGGRFPSERVRILPARPDGLLEDGELGEALREVEHPLVSVMLANNETGVIQPIGATADAVHAAGGLLHVDAVQAAGRIPIRMAELGADLLTLSSHKLGGPQGAGALISRSGIAPVPLIRGGGQERGLRAGTENVAAIAGFGAAAQAALDELDAAGRRMGSLRDRLEAQLRALTPNLIVFGRDAARLPNTSLVAVPGTKAETAVIAFDLNGIALSSGAACSSGKVQASHVLAAMGVEPALARAALRFSVGPTTTETDLERLLTAWKAVVSSLRKGMRGLAA